MFFAADLCLVILSLGLAFVLRYGTLDLDLALTNSWLLFPAMICAGAVLIVFHGLPQIKRQAFLS